MNKFSLFIRLVRFKSEFVYFLIDCIAKISNAK